MKNMGVRRYIQELTEDQLKELIRGYRHGKNANERMQCQAIMLSAEGKSVQDLMSILGVRKNTLYDWFNAWESKGIEGLGIKPGRGRKPKLALTPAIKDLVESKVAQNRQKLALAKADIEQDLGINMHPETLRRFLKSLVIAGVDSVKASKPSKTSKSMKTKKLS